MYTIWYEEADGSTMHKLELPTLDLARLLWDTMKKNNYTMLSTRP
jgi:hypothetical protein